MSNISRYPYTCPLIADHPMLCCLVMILDLQEYMPPAEHRLIGRRFDLDASVSPEQSLPTNRAALLARVSTVIHSPP